MTTQQYENNRQSVKSISKLAGIVIGVYHASKSNKGLLGYVGYAVVGLIGGSIIGSLTANVILQKPNE